MKSSMRAEARPLPPSVSVRDRAGYLPIRDYALIGDCHGAALVGRDGAVDWCCFGRFDADPTLWRLLDARQGPYCQILPEGELLAVERRYLPETNVLETRFIIAEGSIRVLDFMPVWRAPGAPDDTVLTAPKVLVRIVEGVHGRVRVRAHVRQPARAFAESGAIPEPLAMATDTGHDPEDVFVLTAGQRRRFVLGASGKAGREAVETADAALEKTVDFWERWTALCRYRGPHEGPVRRSALALKLMTYAPTGAIVAAPTTSLPERIGGERNWDYRYSWVRDAALSLHALVTLGYRAEAKGYYRFLRLCCIDTLPSLQILYGIEGETDLTERPLCHLDGYRGSRPVRTGNAAHGQRQLDIYGELLDWAYLYEQVGEPLEPDLGSLVDDIANYVAEHWREPDHGIWEMRTPPRQFVHSKLMMYVALDRALRMRGPNPRWMVARDAIMDQVRAQGIKPGSGHLVQAYGSDEVDAALLLVPLLGVPISDTTMDRTLAAIERRLRSGDYIRRYLSDDALSGSEGAFLMCSFWFADALLASGRPAESRALFERLLAQANDVGLYAEEVDPGNDAFLGNFPQAFTHLAIITTAVHLQLAARRGLDSLSGTHADRAVRAAALFVEDMGQGVEQDPSTLASHPPHCD